MGLVRWMPFIIFILGACPKQRHLEFRAAHFGIGPWIGVLVQLLVVRLLLVLELRFLVCLFQGLHAHVSLLASGCLVLHHF